MHVFKFIYCRYCKYYKLVLGCPRSFQSISLLYNPWWNIDYRAEKFTSSVYKGLIQYHLVIYCTTNVIINFAPTHQCYYKVCWVQSLQQLKNANSSIEEKVGLTLAEFLNISLYLGNALKNIIEWSETNVSCETWERRDTEETVRLSSPLISTHAGIWLTDPSLQQIWVGFMVDGVANLYFSSSGCWTRKSRKGEWGMKVYRKCAHSQLGSPWKTSPERDLWPPCPAQCYWYPVMVMVEEVT